TSRTTAPSTRLIGWSPSRGDGIRAGGLHESLEGLHQFDPARDLLPELLVDRPRRLDEGVLVGLVDLHRRRQLLDELFVQTLPFPPGYLLGFHRDPLQGPPHLSGQRLPPPLPDHR